jgi:two-component system sensor histidine kinase KdpD
LSTFGRVIAPYLSSLALVGLFTGIVALVRASAEVSNASMLYLLAVLAAAVFFGLGPATFAAVASFVAFNFFFIEPRYTFTVGNSDEWVALGLLLASGVITGQLAALVRERAREAERREREAVILYDLVRMMSAPEVREAVTEIASRLRAELGLGGVLLAFGREAPVDSEAAAGDPESLALAREAASLAEMILGPGRAPSADDRGMPGRWIRIVPPRAPGSERASRGRVHTVPVNIDGRQAASLILVRKAGTGQFSPADDRLLSAVAYQLGLALQRLRLQRDATEAEALRRTDELRSALLNAVSHDLRTPLSSIIAAAGSLLQEDVAWTDAERRGFSEVVVDEARRLDRLVGNLLDLSRIESGNIHPEKGWYDLGSLIDEVAGRLRRMSSGHTFVLNVPDRLPPVRFDYVEIDQVISNLVENAVNHTPAGTEVTITVSAHAGEVEIEVADCGPGIPEESLPHLFKPFYQSSERTGGSGLGLAVAYGLVEAHGGRITAGNRAEGGARFAFTLPIGERPAEAA